MKPRKKKIIGYAIFLILVLLLMVGYYIYREYNRKLSDTETLKSDYKLSSADLTAAFEKNDSLANRQYLDRVIEVSGTIKELIIDENGFLTVVLGDSLLTASVRCSVDSSHSIEMNKTSKGQQLTMKGICTGFNRDELLGSDVIMVRCISIKK